MSRRVSLNDKVKSTIGALTSNEPIVNNDVNTNVNSDKDINVSENENINVNTNDDTNVNVNKNVNNVIIIAKEKASEELKRQTYYLKPNTIKQIEKIARQANMGKSELVEKILSDALANIVVKD
jgi:hypothetical protein